MPALFDKFVKKIADEGVEVDRVSTTSALIAHAVKNADANTGRQVHSQCSHTDFKLCTRYDQKDIDEEILAALSANRAAARP